jgi:hypothetical protein
VDMPGVPRELIEHSLNVHPKAVPKKQRLRRFAYDKREAIKREIAKLLAAGFIKEVIHPEWVANPVLVKKTMNGECASTTLISTSTAQRTTLGYRALTKLSIQRLVVSFFVFLIVTQVIIRLRSRRRTKSRPHSSPRTGYMPTKPYPSG